MLQMLLVSSITWIGSIQVKQLASKTQKIQKMKDKKQNQKLYSFSQICSYLFI